MNSEELAKLFHETYEELAPAYGYQTREDSAVPWEDVPQSNKELMIATCEVIIARLGLNDEQSRSGEAESDSTDE